MGESETILQLDINEDRWDRNSIAVQLAPNDRAMWICAVYATAYRSVDDIGQGPI